MTSANPQKTMQTDSHTAAKLKTYYSYMSEIYRLQCIMSLLGWDQRVSMPAGASKGRAEQIEYLYLSMHRKLTSHRLGETVDELHDVLDCLGTPDQVNIRETKRALDIERRLPDEFISEFAQVCTLAYSAWEAARPANDFKAVEPFLRKIVRLSKTRCELVGYQGNPYDAMLDMHDPGLLTANVKPLLLDLAGQLRELIPIISERFAGDEPLVGSFDTEVQYRLCVRVAQSLGLSFESGRIDPTAHPFMTSIGPSDVRITVRYDERNFLSGLYDIIHETGHALYELGLPSEYAGTPMGQPASMAVHESQSRLWENVIGRSREFCRYLSGLLPDFFPEHELDPERLWRLVNRVRPSLIRADADEVTYSQHVVVRMLIEEEMINRNLDISDLPDAWNELYEKYLGIRPTDYKDGVMQDVHWYQGAIGYFPTYVLGSVYDAMMMDSAQAAIPGLPQHIESGNFAPLLDWTRENVHRHGMRYRGPELIKSITGTDPSVEPFVRYLKNKFLG